MKRPGLPAGNRRFRPGRLAAVPRRLAGWRLRSALWRAPVGSSRRRWPRLRAGWLPASTLGRVFVAVLAAVTAGAAAWSITRSSLFDVDHIEVRGGFQVAAAEAAEAAGVARGMALVDVDVNAATRRLEALPWVGRARVERVLPNSVHIHLEERTAAAFAARGDGSYALLDETGRVLADRPERPENLAELAGGGEVPAPGQWLAAARPALEVMTALPEDLRRQVTLAVVDGDDVGLRVGARDVRFGPPTQLEAKFAALSSLLAHLGDRPVVSVDVRVPSAPVAVPATAAEPPRASAGTPGD